MWGFCQYPDNLRPVDGPILGGSVRRSRGGGAGGGRGGDIVPYHGEDPPTSLRGLRELGSKSGVKYSSKMDSAVLCGLLGAPPIPTKGRSRKQVTIALTDRETGEILKFPSISGASKFLGVKPGSVAHCVKSAGWLGVNGRTFKVRREE